MVLHLVRRLRPAVPRRHRARRSHHGHAPLPGARRVQLPCRAQRSLQGPGEQGQPVEHVVHRPDGLGQGPASSTSPSSARTSSRWSRSTGCSGSAARAPTRTARRRPPAPSPSCSTWPASASAYSAMVRPAPATPLAARATSSSSRAWPQQNVETFKEFKVKKVVSTCAHCFNTLKNEYKDFGIELEVVHHTQLLNRLVREGKLTPVKEGAGAAKRSITYHDPCYLGRHNQVYEPPRELLEILPGAEFEEMERNSEKSFCCGAGGARMWMEENIGERINLNRTKEAVGTGADQIAVGCPFCRVMLADGLTAEQAAGNARDEVEVLDVAQMLLASVKGESATRATAPASAPSGAASAGTATAAAATDVATKAEPEAGDVTITEDTVTETADAGPAAKASGGSSLFDTPAPAAPAPAAPSGGSLFDTPAPGASQGRAREEGRADVRRVTLRPRRARARARARACACACRLRLGVPEPTRPTKRLPRRPTRRTSRSPPSRTPRSRPPRSRPPTWAPEGRCSTWPHPSPRPSPRRPRSDASRPRRPSLSRTSRRRPRRRLLLRQSDRPARCSTSPLPTPPRARRPSNRSRSLKLQRPTRRRPRRPSRRTSRSRPTSSPSRSPRQPSRSPPRQPPRRPPRPARRAPRPPRSPKAARSSTSKHRPLPPLLPRKP